MPSSLFTDPFRPGAGSKHGPQHWLRVRRHGLMLAAYTPWANPEVVEILSLQHDVERWGEDHDPVHVPKAVVLALQLNGSGGVIDLDEARLRLLIDAIRHHAGGTFSFDPTIGCCWDADRLDLRSVAVEPDAGNMSTEAARLSCCPPKSAEPDVCRIRRY